MGTDNCVEFYMTNVDDDTGKGCCFPSKRPLAGQCTSSFICSHGCGGAHRILTTVCVHDGAETWSTVAIPHPRYGVGAAAVGSKAFWAGGGTDSDKTRVAQVDVYDTAEGTW